MNLPNKLTLLRVALVPFFMFFILFPMSFEHEEATMFFHIAAALIFTIAALTDLFDGRIARRKNLVTTFGKFMDPIADKFMVFGAMLAFIAAIEQFRAMLVWVTAALLLRELAVTSVRLVAQNADGAVIPASVLGKIKTASQCACVLTILLEPYVFYHIPLFSQTRVLTWISIIVMLFFTIYSGIDYISSYWKYLKPEN